MKGKSATLLVLVVAAVVLGCFAVKSYFDFQVTKLKHEYEHQAGKPASAEQANVGTAGVVPPPPGVGVAPAPSPVPPAVAPAPTPDPVPVPPVASALPTAAENSEVAKMKAELDALRRENALIESRANQLSGASGATAPDGGGPATTGEAPSPAPGTLGGAAPLPSDDPKVQALRQQILNAASIGKVAAYLTEFDRVAIEGGSERNIKVDDTFAVRRGYEIMGYLKVEEVDQGSCLAKLTSKNAESDTARKPQAGDDIIKWPLF
jgi:hypothetical protein